MFGGRLASSVASLVKSSGAPAGFAIRPKGERTCTPSSGMLTSQAALISKAAPVKFVQLPLPAAYVEHARQCIEVELRKGALLRVT